MDHDSIIIGSGISGLLTALVLSKKGKKVLILEKSEQIGGVCRSYQVDGYLLDTGPHIITRLDEGPLRSLMDNYFDIIPNFVPHGKYYVRSKRGFKEFPWTISDWLKFDLIPVKDRIRLVKALFSALDKFRTNPEKFKSISIAEYAKKYNFTKSTLNFIEAVSYFLTGGSMEETSMLRLFDREGIINKQGVKAYLEGIFNFLMTEGAVDQGYPRGGLKSLIKSITQSFPEGMVEIKTNCEVKKILTQNGKVVGVSTSENIYNSNLVIYSGFVTNLGGLMDNELPLEYANSLKNIKRINSLSIWLGLKKRYFPHQGTEIWIDSLTQTWAVSTSNYDPSLAPPGRQLVGFLFTMKTPDLEKEKKRGMKTILKVFPSIEKEIDMTHYQMLVPEKAINVIGQTLPSQKTPIDGLYLIGADTCDKSMGITRAAYSVLDCLKFMKEDGVL